jgi:hypothetical protein
MGTQTEFKQALVKNDWMEYPNSHGWGNGYVLISEDHPLYGMDNMSLDTGDDLDSFLNVYGGVTFNKVVDDHIINNFAPESLDEQDKGYYIIGFDTAHSGDNPNDQDYEYVKDQTQRLHDQLVYYYDNPSEVTKMKNYFSRKEVKALINSVLDNHGIHWLDPRTQEWIKQNFESDNNQNSI